MDGLDDLDAPPKVINEDVAKLRQAWISEAACPEILPFDQSLVEGVNKCEEGYQSPHILTCCLSLYLSLFRNEITLFFSSIVEIKGK